MRGGVAARWPARTVTGMETITRTLTPARRAWLYRVLTAAVPLLVIYGITSTEDAALWLALAGSVLGTGVAAANTPTRTPEDTTDGGE